MVIFSNEEYLSRIAKTKQRMLDAGIARRIGAVPGLDHQTCVRMRGYRFGRWLVGAVVHDNDLAGWRAGWLQACKDGMQALLQQGADVPTDDDDREITHLCQRDGGRCASLSQLLVLLEYRALWR